MNDKCHYADKCPIFTGILQDMVVTTKVFKSLYCEGIEGRNQCKRFQCMQKYGYVPDTVLPNSVQTLEDIAKEYHLR
ncbi:MAG: hypothetical protein AB1444_11010 [Spirochaetota bacterium]